MPPLVIVAAVASNGVIGRDNGLIWRLKTDMRHFRAQTLGKPVLMGRKTFDSIGKPLPGRANIVLTRRRGLRIEGARVVHSLDEALSAAGEAMIGMGASEVAVAGGAEIFALTLPLAVRLEMTEVALAPEGDVLFPAIDPRQWRETRREAHPAGPDDEAAFAFVTHVRR